LPRCASRAPPWSCTWPPTGSTPSSRLLEGGYRPDTPVAVVAFASWPQQVVLRGTLVGIAEQLHEAAITKTAVIIVGDVLAAEGFTDSYLYSSGRSRGAGTDAGPAARWDR
jgi:precorrin-4 methylase